jgi:hypothetical protein
MLPPLRADPSESVFWRSCGTPSGPDLTNLERLGYGCEPHLSYILSFWSRCSQAGELMGQPVKRTTTVTVDLGELKLPWPPGVLGRFFKKPGTHADQTHRFLLKIPFSRRNPTAILLSREPHKYDKI